MGLHGNQGDLYKVFEDRRISTRLSLWNKTRTRGDGITPSNGSIDFTGDFKLRSAYLEEGEYLVVIFSSGSVTSAQLA